MTLNNETSKVTNQVSNGGIKNTVAKVVGGMVLGALLATGVTLATTASFAESSAQPLASSSILAEQPMTESIAERLEVQRVVAGMPVAFSTNSESVEERLEVQRVIAGMPLASYTNSESVEERFEVQRVQDTMLNK